MNKFFIYLSILMLGFLTKSTYAQTTFTGLVSNAWEDAGNWDNGLPANGNDATIPAVLEVVISGPLTFDYRINNYGQISNNGNIEIITVDTIRYVNNYGQISNNGSILNDGPILNQNGGIFYNFGEINNTDYISNFGAFFNYGSISNSFELENLSCGSSCIGEFYNLGEITNDNIDASFSNTDSYLYNEGSITNYGNLSNYGGNMENRSGGDIFIYGNGSFYNNSLFINDWVIFNNSVLHNNGQIENNGLIFNCSGWYLGGGNISGYPLEETNCGTPEFCDGLDNDFDGEIDEGCGCTDNTACNYNPSATLDDGSCSYPGCTNLFACNYDPNSLCDDSSCTFPGCTNALACNYTSSAACDDGSCTYPGCTDETACNFNPLAGCDNNSCNFLSGCTDPNACNYNPNAGCDDSSCSYPGCTNVLAFNYDPLAGCDDGSCTFPGCTEPSACNYNPLAAYDDDSCDFSCYGCTDVEACNYSAVATIDLGWCTYPGCKNSIACNFDPNAACDGLCTYPGCTDQTACNYDPNAGCDSGSCVSACSDDCINGDGYGSDFTSYYAPSNWSQNLGINGTIQHEMGSLYITGPRNHLGESNTEVSILVNISGTFTFSWEYHWSYVPDVVFYINGSPFQLTGNYGMWQQGGIASFTANAGDVIGFGIKSIEGDDFEGKLLITNFTYPTATPNAICGCTAPSACNFDPAATVDDGNCTYPGCTSPMACNYDANAGCDDGSCIETQTTELESWPGATGASAPGGIMFDIEATQDVLISTFYLSTTGDVVIYKKTTNGTHQTALEDPSQWEVIFNGILALDNTVFSNTSNFFCESGNLDVFIPAGQIQAFYVIDSGFANFLVDQTEVVSTDGTVSIYAGTIFSDVFNTTGYGDYSAPWSGAINYQSVNTGGCTDSTACNYDASANCDDGSCSYPGCSDVTACNYDSNAGCDDGSCIPLLWYLPNSDVTGPIVLSCSAPVGYFLADQACAQQVVDNDPFCVNNTWDNICTSAYNCCLGNFGCGDPGACNYDPTVCNDLNLCTYSGCVDPLACNYDANAGCDDGSCILPDGCTDATACNYDSSASCDNGSCILPDGCTDTTACNYNPSASCDNGSCILPDGCTDVTACNYDPNAGCDDSSCTYPGCTIAFACNYDPSAACDDGSCTFPGCTDQTACNYDPNAGCDSGSCAANPSPCGDECINAAGDGIDFTSYYAPSNWSQYFGTGDGSIDHNTGSLLITGANIGGGYGLTSIKIDLNKSGTYSFAWDYFLGSDNLPLYDAATYGINGLEIQLTDNFGSNVQSGLVSFTAIAGDFLEIFIFASSGYNGAANLLITNFTYAPEICGCMIPSACNFDPAATVDDGNCTYPGCADSGACNYVLNAGCDDGSCTYPGCTDQTACNYDPNAACDDLSCNYPGCTTALACNYNPSAGCDDGSCEYTSCAGCMAITACNYNPVATIEDGSCEYSSCSGCTYASAVNYDSNAILDDGSCTFDQGGPNDSCSNDMNADGTVNAADLLIFLSAFGTSCE